MQGIKLKKSKKSTKTINRYNVFVDDVDSGFLAKEFYTKRKETKLYPFRKTGEGKICLLYTSPSPRD